MLDIHLLGSFRLEAWGDQIVHRLTPRMQALAAYLLLNQEVPQARSFLASLLWPDTGEGQSRTNLRNLLYRMRNAVPALEPFLVEEHGFVAWRSDGKVRLDVHDFSNLVDQARSCGSNGDFVGEQDALKQAEQIYTGELLPGMYDDWVLPYRETFHQMYLVTLDRLGILHENHLEYRQAMHYCQLSLRLDPLNEATYRRLMRYHGLYGDRTGGIRVYQACAAVFQQELGIEPDEATREVLDELVRGQSEQLPLVNRRPADLTDPGSIPSPLTSFIGRKNEMGELLPILQQNRLVTLIGPPGAGKTRLAMELAMLHRDQPQTPPAKVVWVDLTEVSDQYGVSASISAAVSVREEQDKTLLSSLIDHLRDWDVLLVLDNTEHITAAARETANRLLIGCPNLRLLVTSREALGLSGEVIWDLPALNYPGQVPELREQAGSQDSLENILTHDAVQLFVERAFNAIPTFRLTRRNAQAVVHLCQRLEGIPLAIELAAARVRLMSPEQILDRLLDSGDILKTSRGITSTRYKTLEGAVDWSYRLLSDNEKSLLRKLSVFAGSFSLDGAGFVAAPDSTSEPGNFDSFINVLSNLVDKSLVKVDAGEPGGEVRYSLLEMIRRFAAARLLETGEEIETARRRTRFFIKLAEEADQRLRGPDQADWLNLLELEHDNFRKSVRWAVERDDSESGLLLVTSLWQFWDIRGYFREGRQWIKRVLDLKGDDTPQRAKAYKAAGALAWSQSDYAEAQQMMRESLRIYRELGEKRDVAVGLFNLGLVTYSRQDYSGAVPIVQESLALFKEIGHQQGIANALNSLGVIASGQGEYDRARNYFEESLAIRHELGDKRGLAIAYGNLGVAAMHQGHLDEAEALMNDGLRLYREIGDKRGIATSLNELGQLANRTSQQGRALTFFREAAAVWQELGSKEGLAGTFEGVAAAAEQTNAEQAARLLAAAAALREACGSPLLPADTPAYQALLDRLQSVMPQNAFARAWREGRTLSAVQAIEVASTIR